MFPVVEHGIAVAPAAAAAAAAATLAAATIEGNPPSHFPPANSGGRRTTKGMEQVPMVVALLAYPVAGSGETCIDAATVLASAPVPEGAIAAAIPVPGFSARSARTLRDGEAIEWYRKEASSINIVPPLNAGRENRANKRAARLGELLPF